jgi:hypothetical protein
LISDIEKAPISEKSGNVIRSEIFIAPAQTGPAGLIFSTVLNPGWVTKSSVNLDETLFYKPNAKKEKMIEWIDKSLP